VAEGIQDLGQLPGGGSGGAYGLSGDGAIAVGISGVEPFYWTATSGLLALPRVVGSTFAVAYALSANGSVAVGYDNTAALTWTLGGGAPALTVLPNPNPLSGVNATCVSANGRFVGGRSGTDLVRWRDGVAGNLGSVAGALGISFDALSAEGNAGAATATFPVNNKSVAYRWVEGVGLIPLPNLTGGDDSSIAGGITADGLLVVGLSSETPAATTAVLWPALGGVQRLWDVLIAQGADLSAWVSLDEALAVSADGRFIVGSGLSASSFFFEAFVAEITPPAPPASTPLGNVPALPGRLQAENYDLGGPLVGYFDTTIGNSGNSGVRPGDAVDISTTTGSDGTPAVAFSERDWLRYTVNVTQGGTYTLRSRVAKATAGIGTLLCTVNGNPLTISVPSTGGAQTWVNVEQSVVFTAGIQIIELRDLAGDFSLNWLEVVPAGVFRELWTGVSGNKVSQIPVTRPPNSTANFLTLETPQNQGDRYGERLRGYVRAPVTGNYRLWISGDDDCDLFLGTNDNSATRRRIAFINGWTNFRQWNKFNSQRSGSIALTGGELYYVEVLHKEGSGGDHVSVGWSRPGQSINAPSELVPSNVLTPFTGP